MWYCIELMNVLFYNSLLSLQKLLSVFVVVYYLAFTSNGIVNFIFKDLYCLLLNSCWVRWIMGSKMCNKNVTCWNLKTQKYYCFLSFGAYLIYDKYIHFFPKWWILRVILPDPTSSLSYISSVIRTSPHFGCVWLF